MTSLILATAARYLLPLLLLFSIFLLMRGHHEPGGGFAGGLVASAAFVLLAVSSDVETARRALRVTPHTLLGLGLLVALASGLIGLVQGQALLTGRWIRIELSEAFTLDVGTPLLFDVGVYLVVLGTAMAIILNLAEEET